MNRRHSAGGAPNDLLLLFDEIVSLFGSVREFVDKRILGGFLKDDEFGLGDRHALSLEQ
jgi:hypothetical protein